MQKILNSVAATGATLLTLSVATSSQAAQFYYGLSGDTNPAVSMTAKEAENAFLAKFKNIYVEDFESYPTGTTAFGNNTLDIDFKNGATATLSGGGAIRDAEFQGLHGISGNKYWSLTYGEQVQDSYTISFSQGQAAVGFYTTDMGDAGKNQFSLQLKYDDNSEQTVILPHGDTNASEFYFGYLDPTKLLKSITYLANGPINKDGFGLDNLTIANAEQIKPVPEYTSIFALFAVAALGAGSLVKYRPQ